MPKSSTPTETRLDSDTTKPSTTAPGDGPADTTDPSERASSVLPQPGPEAVRTGTVNAVVPLDPIPGPEGDRDGDEYEEYEATKPNGDKVTVRRNLRTGESKVSG